MFFLQVNTEAKFWNWTKEALIPELFAGKWYNNRKPLGLQLMANDRNNFRVGYPLLRQVRVAKGEISRRLLLKLKCFYIIFSYTVLIIQISVKNQIRIKLIHR